MLEGHHSYRRRRRSPRKSEWESNSKHVYDMTELSRRIEENTDAGYEGDGERTTTLMMNWISMTCGHPGKSLGGGHDHECS